MKSLSESCLQNETVTYYLPDNLTISQQNQLDRFSIYAVEQNVKLIVDSNRCFNSFITPSILLVDHQNNLRGIYDLSLVEIDRALIEIDLLSKLQDESGNWR